MCLLLSFFFLTTLSLVVKINAKSKVYAESTVIRLHYMWSWVEFTPKRSVSWSESTQGWYTVAIFHLIRFVFTRAKLKRSRNCTEKTFDPKCHLVIGHTVQWSLQPIACCKLRSGSLSFCPASVAACLCRAGGRCSGEADASTGIGLEHFYT